MTRVWKDRFVSKGRNRSTRSFRRRRRIWDANRVKIWWRKKRRRAEGTNGRGESWRNLGTRDERKGGRFERSIVLGCRNERVEFVEGGARITIRNNPPPPWRTCTSNRCIRWRRPHHRAGSAYNAWLFTNLAHPRLDNHLSQPISIRSWLPSGSGLNTVSERTSSRLRNRHYTRYLFNYNERGILSGGEVSNRNRIKASLQMESCY